MSVNTYQIPNNRVTPKINYSGNAGNKGSRREEWQLNLGA